MVRELGWWENLQDLNNGRQKPKESQKNGGADDFEYMPARYGPLTRGGLQSLHPNTSKGVVVAEYITYNPTKWNSTETVMLSGYSVDLAPQAHAQCLKMGAGVSDVIDEHPSISKL